jgi:hypothetical protein
MYFLIILNLALTIYVLYELLRLKKKPRERPRDIILTRPSNPFFEEITDIYVDYYDSNHEHKVPERLQNLYRIIPDLFRN